ncbi:MAG: SDR family NAD(P)-dependent oxidoreductase [Myxococcales bacterium]|jgi:short-subunit dehydrogenase
MGRWHPRTTGSPLAAITGASSGIGAAFARKLAARGFHLLLVAREPSRLERLAGEMAGSAAGVELLAADLAQPGPLGEVERRLAAAERLSLLVNNAGLGGGDDFRRTAPDFHERMVRLHVLAPVRLVHAALPRLQENRGAVVNVSSLSASLPAGQSAVYSATKAFLSFFSEALGAELGGAGVRVQALCPGFTRTGLHQRAGLDVSSIPAWLWMEADEVVEASLAALERGRALCVPGLANRAVAALAGLLPRPLLRAALRQVASRGPRGRGASGAE